MEGKGVYVGVDVGGTKTLIALFSKSGEILHEVKFLTDKSYPRFLKTFVQELEKVIEGQRIEAICFAAPGMIDRKHGIGIDFGNLPWHKVAIVSDVQKYLPGTKVLIENDANLAGLSEALLVQEKYKSVLYLTISTGIGDGIIINGIIDPNFADSEPGFMVLYHEGKLTIWEEFASGEALVKQTGKMAKDLTDEKAWFRFCGYLAQGIDPLVAAIRPDVVIIGGSVGAHFDKFGHFLSHQLKKYENKIIKMPPVIGAKRPEEAVIYGCYEFIKQNI